MAIEAQYFLKHLRIGQSVLLLNESTCFHNMFAADCDGQ